MVSTSIRRAVGAVKDQTSIGLAKVGSTISVGLDVAIIKATSHNDRRSARDRHVREILTIAALSPAHASACVAAVYRRLFRTRDWVVALKALALVHRLIADGSPTLCLELLHGTSRAALSLTGFCVKARNNSWDHPAFVRAYALFLDQRLVLLAYNLNHSSTTKSVTATVHRDYQSSYNYYYAGNLERRTSLSVTTPVREMKTERVFDWIHQLQRLMDRFLACRPTGAAKQSRLVVISLYSVIHDSFQLYANICGILAVLLDRFFDMDFPDCVKAFEAYASAAKQIDELIAFYNWSKDIGVARSSEYPEVQRIADNLLKTLEEFMRERARSSKSPERLEAKPDPPVVDREPIVEEDMNTMQALPWREDFNEHQDPSTEPAMSQAGTGDLIDLKEESVSADVQGNKMTLALFSGETANSGPNKNEGVVTAWKNPAMDAGKADWELVLVETASNLSKQKANLGGGFDPLLLNDMYDQGTVRHQVGLQTSAGGRASSVALPGRGKSKAPVLALPAPNGTVKTVGKDPFEASLSIPPPVYVQMAGMGKKQELLVQEREMWEEYRREGMRGQMGLAKLAQSSYYYGAVAQPQMIGLPYYGMPMAPANGVESYAFYHS